jgi:hypothetical protein
MRVKPDRSTHPTIRATPSVRRIGCILGFFAFGSPGVLLCQEADEVVVRDPPSCPECEIRLEHVVTLGDREGPGRVMSNSVLARDSKGNYYVAHGDGGGGAATVWVFDTAGTFLRTFGRRGDGPGEYRAIGRMVFLPGDTLEVYDSGLRRKTVLAPDLSVTGTNRFEVASYNGGVFLGDGRVVVNDHRTTPEQAGYPLQLVDRSGEIVRSLGAIKPEYRSNEPWAVRKVLAPGPDGGSVWSIGRTSYLIELWDTTGARVQALRRDADWFEPWVLDAPWGPDQPPPKPMVGEVKADADGRLWVHVLVAAENWRDGLINRQGMGWEPDVNRTFDPVLEIIDPKTGQLLMSRRFTDRDFVGFVGDDMIASYREDEMGYPFLDLWRISFVGP